MSAVGAVVTLCFVLDLLGPDVLGVARLASGPGLGAVNKVVRVHMAARVNVDDAEAHFGQTGGVEARPARGTRREELDAAA
jgi:hypothetical protein